MPPSGSKSGLDGLHGDPYMTFSKVFAGKLVRTLMRSIRIRTGSSSLKIVTNFERIQGQKSLTIGADVIPGRPFSLTSFSEQDTMLRCGFKL